MPTISAKSAVCYSVASYLSRHLYYFILSLFVASWLPLCLTAHHKQGVHASVRKRPIAKGTWEKNTLTISAVFIRITCITSFVLHQTSLPSGYCSISAISAIAAIACKLKVGQVSYKKTDRCLPLLRSYCEFGLKRTCEV